MSTNPPRPYSPALLSIIPMLYIGWADNVLSPSEVKAIRKKTKSLGILSAKDLKTLDSWSDPKNPPSEKQFREWVKLIKQAAETLPNARQSLADLGLEIARIHSDKTDFSAFVNDETKLALDTLEETLGIVSLDSHRNILTEEQRLLEIDSKYHQASFDTRIMRDILDDDYSEIRQKVRTLLKDPLFRYKALPTKEEYRAQVSIWCKALADQGLGAIAYPDFAGGKDDMGEYAAVFEEIGYHDLSLLIKFGVQFGLFGGSIQRLGTAYHHKKYLKKTGTLELAGCFAMTETNHGSNVRGLETTATYDPFNHEIIIHTPHEKAGKEYIGNALDGKMASVFAQLYVDGENCGVHAILVPLRDEEHQLLPGIRVEDNGYKLGLNGVDNGRIWFNYVRVPKENLLNRFGDINEEGKYSSPIKNPAKRFFTMLGTLVGGRVCVPRAGLSAAKSGLAIAIKYALKRRQFGPDGQAETVILDYPSHQKRLMPLLAKTYALDFALTYLTKRFVASGEGDIREIETLAAGLKSYATWHTTATLQECREACGGKGYLAENRFAQLKSGSDIFTTFEGDNTVLYQLVAKGVLSSFQQEFHDDKFLGVIRFLYKQASTAVTELNPITIRNTDRAHLLDPEFHISAFKYRERTLQVNTGRKMQALRRAKVNSYDAYLQCQTQMIGLADAYVERVILEQFQKAIGECTDKACKTALQQTCNLFALNSIHQHRGWYLEEGYLESKKSKAIGRQVEKLCKIVRMDAPYYIESFGISDEVLGAPIAFT